MKRADVSKIKAEARSKGEKFYSTGRPCKKGHVCDRRLSDNHCVDCSREQMILRSADPSFQVERRKSQKAKYQSDPVWRAKRNASANARRLSDPDTHLQKRRQREFERYRDDPEYREKRRRENRTWWINNPAKTRAYSSKWRAARRQAAPAWMTTDMWEQIEQIHGEAARLQAETGTTHAVDHVIPLDGKTVCGLHVPWNLTVMTHSANSGKSNRLPDDPADWCACPHALDLPHHQVAASPVS